MASANTLCKNLLNVNDVVIENHDFYSDSDGVKHLRIKARPKKWKKNFCPTCGRKCLGYDQATTIGKI